MSASRDHGGRGGYAGRRSQPQGRVLSATTRLVAIGPGQAVGALAARGHGDTVGEMAIPVRFDHCVVKVSEWDTSNAFYRDVVGADVVPTGQGGWAYRLGEQQLNLHGPGVTAEPLARRPVEPGNSDLCFTWDGRIEDAAAHLERQGVEVELGPVQRFGARGVGTSIYFRDPDGSLLEFICYG
jgi:catechol 2,3-dioxygenase-like lactoylglutathione lyase family enzyme